MAWKLLNSRLHLKNQWLTLHENDYLLPGGKRLESYWVMEKCSYVLVVGESSRGLVLVREYRPGSDTDQLGFPAGFIDSGESPEQAAVREFREETGYLATNPRLLGVLDAQSAWLSVKCNIVYVECGDHPEATIVDTEIDEVLLLGWPEVLEKVRAGGITEMHAVAGFYMALDRLGKA